MMVIARNSRGTISLVGVLFVIGILINSSQGYYLLKDHIEDSDIVEDDALQVDEDYVLNLDNETTGEPDATSHEPETTQPTETSSTSAPPLTTNTELDTTTMELITTTQEATTAAPEPTTIAPAPTTIAPAPTTIAPEPTTIAPEPTTIAPAPTTIAPVPTTIALAPTTIAPEPTTTPTLIEETTTSKVVAESTTPKYVEGTTDLGLTTDNLGFTEDSTLDFVTDDVLTTIEPETTTEGYITEEEGTVTIRIFNISDSEFNQTDIQESLTRIMGKYITEYCQVAGGDCPNNDTVVGEDVIISDTETEVAEDLEEDDLLWDYLDEFNVDTNLLVSLYVQRADGEPGALLSKDALDEAITMYADDIAAEFGYPIEIAAPEPTSSPSDDGGGLTDWQIALIAVGGAAVVTTAIAVPIAVVQKKKRNKLTQQQRFSVNGHEIIFAGPDHTMKNLDMADILADGPSELITTDSAKLVGSGFFTHNSFFDNPTYNGDAVYKSETKPPKA